MTILGMLFTIVFGIYLGIRSWKKNKLISFLGFSPLIISFGFLIYVTYNSIYHTTPESLTFKAEVVNDTYTVNGKWNKRIDTYSFVTDFIVFFVPEDTHKIKLKRDQTNVLHKEDLPFLTDEVIDSIRDIQPDNTDIQVFDIKSSQQFNFSFTLPQDIKPADIKVYYIHAREEPMETLEFWNRQIKLY